MTSKDQTRLVLWFAGHDTGASSKAIATHMSGVVNRKQADYPRDPDDLGRCLRLLERFPQWKTRIGEMAAYGQGWLGLAPHWDRIATMMDEEVGIDWSKGRRAPKTYAEMHRLIDEGLKADPNIVVKLRADGSVCGWESRR